MKKLLIILTATFNFYCINQSYSQKTVTLNTTSGGGYSLNNFSKIDVINNLPDSNILGYIPSDIMNDRKFIKSPGDITSWLQGFINKQFGSSVDSKAKKILWVIEDLSAGKDSTQKQAYSFVKLKADIYAGNGLGNTVYQIINTFDSTWVTTDENADFGKMIAGAFIDLYKNTLAVNNTISNNRFHQLTGSFSGTKDEILKSLKSSDNYPILKDNTRPDGIYLSFNEFKNNSPSVDNFYADVNPKNNEVELYRIMADSSSQLIQNAWGASVNNELYFYSSGQLYPIEKSGNSFYMAKYLDYRTRKNQAFYWRKYVGSKQSDNNPYNDAHILRKNVATANKISLEATHLDFDQEDFTF